MPELPEVETIRQKLAPHVVGRRFDRVEIGDARLVRPFEPGAVAAELEGERVSALERRGKYLIVRFKSGRALLIHLRICAARKPIWNRQLSDMSILPRGSGRKKRSANRNCAIAPCSIWSRWLSMRAMRTV